MRQVFWVQIYYHVLFHVLFDQMQLTLIVICFVEEEEEYIQIYPLKHR